MATRPVPVPRKWNSARKTGVKSNAEIIEVAYRLMRNPKYAGDPGITGPLGQIIYLAHHTIGQLTSVPAEDEKE